MNDVLNFFDPVRLRSMASDAIPRLSGAVLVLVTLWVVLRVTLPLLRGALRRARFADALIEMLVDGVYRWVVIGVAIITVAGQLGLNVAAALAGLGVLGIALGFAAQETVSNMISGFLVFWDRPFKIGDYITTQEEYGRVQEITMRTTRIRTMENAFVVIPNGQIMGRMLVNHSMYGEVRINVKIGIAYKERIAAARAVLLPAISALPHVLAQPPAEVIAHALGDSSVNLEARVWIADAALERPTRFAVVEACKTALDDAGISIPYPHLSLFVEDVSEKAIQRLTALRSRPGQGRPDGA